MKFALSLAIIIFGVSFASAQYGGSKKMKTMLSGAAEVPGPGDTDGSGKASISINRAQTQVCYEISVSKIAAATMAHIHEGAWDVAGPVAVSLTTPGANGKSKGCVEAAPDIIKRLIDNPENFYINVHTTDFAAGAIRGQLGKK
ncbi:MAG: CHRD domain-containing protein [Pyrinomonadaceae bacterium]